MVVWCFPKRKSIISFWIFIASIPTLFLNPCYSDVVVTSGGGPTFPLQIDSAFLFIWQPNSNGNFDSCIIILPNSLYAELRENIDSVFNYAQAMVLKRKELRGCGKNIKYNSCLSFVKDNKIVLKILFSCDNYQSAKVITSQDRYPFVIKFSKNFSQKIKKYITDIKK